MNRTSLSWIEIDRAALVHNLREFSRLIGPRCRLLAVVKANAYGHGMLEVSRILTREGVDWLGVNSLEEAAALRKAGIKAHLLVLGYVPLAGLDEAVRLGIRLTVYNEETV